MLEVRAKLCRSGPDLRIPDLDRPGAYVRILFVDFSTALNTIISNLLLPKPTQLSVPTSIYQWINSFLTDRQQLMLRKYISSTRTISADPRLLGALRKTVSMAAGRGGGGWFEWLWILKSRSPKALEKQCLFRGSLCFQLIFLVSSKRLYNIHMIWLIFK